MSLKHQTISGIKCALCQSEEIVVKFTKKDIDATVDLLECKKCGLVFLRPEASALNQENQYWHAKKQEQVYFEEKIEDNAKADFLRKLRTIRELVLRGKLLDVGCGTGQFLNLAKDDGWEVYGLDISPEAARIAKEKYGISVFAGKPEDYPNSEIVFDCVTMWDVVEHLVDPASTLKFLSSKMKKGSIVVIRTPNENALFRKAAHFLAFLGVKSFLRYVYYIPHYVYFNIKTLMKLLISENFEIMKIGLENTDLSFAQSKISAHYKTREKALVKMLLPLLSWVSKLARMQNKLVILARKAQ